MSASSEKAASSNQFAPLSQLAEKITLNDFVAGSTPARSANLCDSSSNGSRDTGVEEYRQTAYSLQEGMQGDQTRPTFRPEDVITSERQLNKLEVVGSIPSYRSSFSNTSEMAHNNQIVPQTATSGEFT